MYSQVGGVRYNSPGQTVQSGLPSITTYSPNGELRGQVIHAPDPTQQTMKTQITMCTIAVFYIRPYIIRPISA